MTKTNACCDRCDAHQFPPVYAAIHCWNDNCECHINTKLTAALRDILTYAEFLPGNAYMDAIRDRARTALERAS